MIAALQPGAFYHIAALEGPRYAPFFDRLIRPEAMDEAALRDVGTLLVPCRTNPDRLRPHAGLLVRFLARGGTLVAMGETFQDRWLPGLSLTAVPTNWWWWLEPGADLGLRILRRDHPLMRGLSEPDCSWHLHGWFTPAPGAEVLIADAEGRAVLFVDEASHAPGRLVATTLDPFYHHGSQFMPATTRFLDRFLPNLRDWSLR
jgi:hypothetical protein